MGGLEPNLSILLVEPPNFGFEGSDSVIPFATFGLQVVNSRLVCLVKGFLEGLLSGRQAISLCCQVQINFGFQSPIVSLVPMAKGQEAGQPSKKYRNPLARAVYKFYDLVNKGWGFSRGERHLFMNQKPSEVGLVATLDCVKNQQDD